MVYAFLVLALAAYSMGIFFIESWEVLYWLGVSHVILMAVLLISPGKLVRSLLFVTPFIVFTALVNWAFADLQSSLMIGARIYLLCNATFIFSQRVPVLKFAKGVSILLYPLKVFKLSPRDIAITITIAITFIPILRQEFISIRQTMNAKCKRRSLKITTKVIAYKILYRAGNISETLEAKGFRG